MSALPPRTAIAELLLASGADVRARDKNGQTPLHTAALFAEEPQLRLLIDRGRAEIDARDAAGRTPLHLAADVGRVEATAFLVSRGADVSLRDHEGRTPLDCAWKIHAQGILSEHQREQLERLLAGFMTAQVVEARPDSLILWVESVHSRFTEADRRATERGTLTIPSGAFREAPIPGQLIRCEKGLTPALDEAWNRAHKRDLGIERER